MITEKEIVVSGGVVRIAKLRHEWFDFLQDPLRAIRTMQRAKGADLFTFLGDLNDEGTGYPFYKETPAAAVLPATTYQIRWSTLDSTVLNQIRHPYKNGAKVCEAE